MISSAVLSQTERQTCTGDNIQCLSCGDTVNTIRVFVLYELRNIQFHKPLFSCSVWSAVRSGWAHSCQTRQDGG